MRAVCAPTGDALDDSDWILAISLYVDVVLARSKSDWPTILVLGSAHDTTHVRWEATQSTDGARGGPCGAHRWGPPFSRPLIADLPDDGHLRRARQRQRVTVVVSVPDDPRRCVGSHFRAHRS